MEDLGRRILVLSPHPDDEVVGAGVLMRRAIEAGATVFVRHLTTGVPAPDTLWPWQRSRQPSKVAQRRSEAESVAAALGVTTVGFDARPTRTLRNDLAAARSGIAATLRDHSIDALWVPAYEGGHSDHDAANALASTFRKSCRVFEFAEYNFAGGAIHSQTFMTPSDDATIVTLTADETAEKRRLLGLYASEKGNLGYVDSAREAIRPLVEYDYAAPPHEGRLFYQRFQWVPFRHPRIDWTTPAEVSTDILNFLKTIPRSA